MLVGHQKQWRFLRKIAESGKIPHAFLFSGQEKLGKKKVAFEFISFLLGAEVEKGAHADFVFIEPLGKEIKISQIRDLIWKLSLKNFSSPFKAAIIDRAHSMNQEAQSCLLKTLEEPRGKTILILITEHPDILFPTIVSRCQTIKFFPVKGSEIENYLTSKGASGELAKEITQICGGRPGRALDLLSEPEKLAKYRKTISDLIKTFNSSLNFRFQYAKSISEKSKAVKDDISNEANNLNETLEIWLGYLRQILLLKMQDRPARIATRSVAGGPARIAAPAKNAVSTAGWQSVAGGEETTFKNFSLAKLKNLIGALQKTIFLITTKNINQRLALENLMLEM